jgi:hypothetical protein
MKLYRLASVCRHAYVSPEERLLTIWHLTRLERAMEEIFLTRCRSRLQGFSVSRNRLDNIGDVYVLMLLWLTRVRGAA